MSTQRQQPERSGHRETNQAQPVYQATAKGHGYDRSMGSNAQHGAGLRMGSKGDDTVAQVLADELLREPQDDQEEQDVGEAPEDVDRPDPGPGRAWGIVRKWVEDKGFGFIKPCDNSAELFAHRTSITGQGLTEGESVTFATRTSARTGRPEAADVQGPGVWGEAAAAGGAPARGGYGGGGGGPEKRRDAKDGKEYTKQEFRTFYNGFKEWDAAAPDAAAAPADFPGLGGADGATSPTPAPAKPAPKWAGTGASGGMADALRTGMAKQQGLGFGVRTAASTTKAPPPGQAAPDAAPDAATEEKAQKEQQQMREDAFPALPTRAPAERKAGGAKPTAPSKMSKMDQLFAAKPGGGAPTSTGGKPAGKVVPMAGSGAAGPPRAGHAGRWIEVPEGKKIARPGQDEMEESHWSCCGMTQFDGLQCPLASKEASKEAGLAAMGSAIDGLLAGGGQKPGQKPGGKKKKKGQTISLTGGGMR